MHQKNLAQHAANLEMLQATDHLKAVFLHEETGKVKEIECIWVDTASDEGPSHTEVQFLWTGRHMNWPTKVTLVTTRSNGDSFLNQVELKSGCLITGSPHIRLEYNNKLYLKHNGNRINVLLQI